MNGSSLTGLVLIAGIAVWLGAFLPAWRKRGIATDSVREATSKIKQQTRTDVSVRTRSFAAMTAKVSRLAVARRVLGVVTLLAVVAALVSLVSVTTLWPITAISAATAVVAVIANRAAASAIARGSHAAPLAKAMTPGMYSALYAAAEQYGAKVTPVEEPESQGWVPRALPAPMHVGHVGTLEQPVLAEVTSLEPAIAAAQVQPEVAPEVAVSGANLDEILRRRRAV